MGTVTQKTICFCSDPVLQGRLAGQGIGARVFDEILSREEKTAMLESLDCFASRWFLNEKGSDYTEYRGVSLGAALHDEVMIFFHLLLHFIYIIDKLGPEYKVVFYHSDSCLMPDPVIRFLVQEQVEVRRAAEKYPWISYKEQFERQAYSNFSRISFWPAGGLRSKQGQIKLGIKQMLSRIFYRMFHNPKRLLYFHAHRSLVDFYESFLSRDGNTFGICITDTTPLEPKKDKKGQNFYKDVCRLFRIARKGVMLDSLKCPFYYAWYRDYSRFSSFRGLRAAFAQEFRGQTAAFGQVRNKDLLRHFERLFEEFYAGHLVQCMKLVDFYYEKFSALKPYLCLQEMCHPFQAQVLSLLGIPCRMYPSNYIIHNQYFAPALFKKTGSFFKAVSFSRLDAERFRRLGFETANIHTVEPDLFRNWFEKIQPVHGIDTLKGKRVLILAPSIIALHTFRYQVQSSRLYVFFTDVFEVLSKAGVASVTVRPHPGATVSRNRFGYTDNDIMKYLIGAVSASQKTFELKFSDSFYHNLEDDIEANDIALGNMTGALFELLIHGRDYIYYDDTVTPSYGIKDWTLFNEGTIKRLRTKDELRDYVLHYRSSDLEGLRSQLFEHGSRQEKGAIPETKNTGRTSVLTGGDYR